MMNENSKTERVRVLGVQVDSMKIDRAVTLTNRYLEKHKFEYIVFANTPAALAGQDEDFYKDYMEQAALVLPGDENIENAVEVKSWLNEGVSYQAEYFRRLFARLYRQHASIYMLAEKEEQRIKVRSIIKKKYNRIQLETILWQEEESVDHLLNGINSMAPDVLLICGKHERIGHFLMEHGCKINANLCLCVEEIATDQDIELDEKLHMSGLKKKLHDIGGWGLRLFHNHLFKHQMKQEQKNGETDGDMDQPEELEEE